MHIQQTVIEGVMVVETTPFVDQRGAFLRLFCERELSAILGERRIVQINYSRTEAVGTIRGLHYQRPPHAEMKLVRCLRGRVWDVALDLRQGSPTFLHWHAEELTPDNAQMLVIPEGCAHGFQALEAGMERHREDSGVRAELSQRLGHAPTPTELAAELGMDREEVVEGLRAAE